MMKPEEIQKLMDEVGFGMPDLDTLKPEALADVIAEIRSGPAIGDTALLMGYLFAAAMNDEPLKPTEHDRKLFLEAAKLMLAVHRICRAKVE